MINISIDPPDMSNFKNGKITYKEDLAINETESIYELISEGIFQKDVPESDEDDADTYLEIFDLYCFSSIDGKITVSKFSLQHNQYYKDNFLAHYPEPNSPPPKQA